MFRHPAFGFAEIGRYTQREALFAQKHVSAVVGVDGHNKVFFGEMADISLFFGEFRVRVKSLYEVAVAERVENFLTNSRHNSHIENDVDRVGEFDTDFGEFAADRTHRVRNNVHSSAFHNAVEQTVQEFKRFARFHPVVDGRGVVFVFRTNKGSAFHSRDVVYRRAVKIATGQFFLIELYKNFFPYGLLS